MKSLRDRVRLVVHPFSEVSLRCRTAAIDASWRRTADYLARNHRETIQRSRRWHGDSVAMPVLLFEDHGIRFLDGRHRFAAMRDAGCRWVPIATAKHMVKAAVEGGYCVK